MNRKSTNFCSEISTLLYDEYEKSELKDSLTYYQILTATYAKMNVSKGVFLWHHMGFGKTIGAYHIADTLKDAANLIITPRSLQKNFQNSLDKYKQFTGREIDQSKLHFIKNSSTTEKQIVKAVSKRSDLFDGKMKSIITTMENLDGFNVFIDEAHVFIRKIVNGSKFALQLYDLMMRSKCRIFLLSGSMIASSPFELAPICNLLAGEVIFPENADDFQTLFIDKENNCIKNKDIFQDRIFGLFSRMKPEYLDEKEMKSYPKELPTIVERLPMGKEQLHSYLTTRRREIDDDNARIKHKSNRQLYDRFAAKDDGGGTYRVRSRQACNFTPSARILKYYKDRDYTLATIEAEVNSFTLEESSSNKAEWLKSLLLARGGKQKGVIYSQFTGFSGCLSIANFLRKCGATELGGKSIGGELDFITFTRVNGSMKEEEQDAAVAEYNSGGCNLIIIGKEQCQGLDLVGVRYIVMWECYFTDFIRDQLKYRGIRKGSHLGLPEEERDVQFYILISTYPDGFADGEMKEIVQEEYWREMQTTTDEFMYEIMIGNAGLVDSFKEAVEEVSIECELVKQFNPKANHNCRTCSPNDKVLYTSTDDVMSGIMQDIKLGTQCVYNPPKKVKADKVEIAGDTYYKVKADNIRGYNLFAKNGKKYVKLRETSTLYNLIKEP